ncbi:hypothetical protein AJ79_07563 [Helicocarpus griseus UAMH5409]|uniref:FCP1 homology domain-containing protein n=1 Tax=Helicocarpus griseus UAMH5409 TaxID=1447875 RepID=A0A2B7WTI4_9EURO|nr:hypothetical protein AJ79_07563 [Helicocarpus griseus UAMH5409]
MNPPYPPAAEDGEAYDPESWRGEETYDPEAWRPFTARWTSQGQNAQGQQQHQAQQQSSQLEPHYEPRAPSAMYEESRGVKRERSLGGTVSTYRQDAQQGSWSDGRQVPGSIFSAASRAATIQPNSAQSQQSWHSGAPFQQQQQQQQQHAQHQQQHNYQTLRLQYPQQPFTATHPFTPINAFNPINGLNPMNSFNPMNFNPMNAFNPFNPFNPFSPLNPFSQMSPYSSMATPTPPPLNDQQQSQQPTPRPPSNNARTSTPRRPVTPLTPPTPTPSYLSTSLLSPTLLPAPQPLLIILDLNGTLIYRIGRRPIRFKTRPGLHAFIDELCAKYTVMVWTSSQPPTVREVLEKTFSKEERERFVAVWARDTLGLNPRQYAEKVQVYKRLEKVWGDGGVRGRFPGNPNNVGNSACGGGGGKKKKKKKKAKAKAKAANDFNASLDEGPWNQSNTLLIDDSALKALAQPYNIIEIPEFTNELPAAHEEKVLDTVLRQLRVLSRHRDVSCKVREWEEARRREFERLKRERGEEDAKGGDGERGNGGNSVVPQSHSKADIEQFWDKQLAADEEAIARMDREGMVERGTGHDTDTTYTNHHDLSTNQHGEEGTSSPPYSPSTHQQAQDQDYIPLFPTQPSPPPAAATATTTAEEIPTKQPAKPRKNELPIHSNKQKQLLKAEKKRLKKQKKKARRAAANVAAAAAKGAKAKAAREANGAAVVATRGRRGEGKNQSVVGGGEGMDAGGGVEEVRREAYLDGNGDSSGSEGSSGSWSGSRDVSDDDRDVSGDREGGVVLV